MFELAAIWEEIQDAARRLRCGSFLEIDPRDAVGNSIRFCRGEVG
jgi:hypothetical protein